MSERNPSSVQTRPRYPKRPEPFHLKKGPASPANGTLPPPERPRQPPGEQNPSTNKQGPASKAPPMKKAPIRGPHQTPAMPKTQHPLGLNNKMGSH